MGPITPPTLSAMPAFHSWQDNIFRDVFDSKLRCVAGLQSGVSEPWWAVYDVIERACEINSLNHCFLKILDITGKTKGVIKSRIQH